MATLRAALDRLYQRRRFGLRPGLDVVRALLGALDHPERTFPAIHVTGSKGKGSVAAMAEAILSASGLKTGLFTSPHLQSFRERIRIGREPVPPDALVAGLDRVEHAAAELERTGAIDRAPTFFEVTTAVAFDWFRGESVDAAVVEV
ncbi:MAG TPA: bifunctional folylpolyglutamate synthase/dihydrofolate synthase, partial [Thermoplasmata archaeon]|nr:bifunctional folylpolyglutamate synthase/dihydrofolate synthase [Thermoplasmata archaeon]